MSSKPQHVTVDDQGQTLADATLHADPERHTLHADLHVETGHLPAGTRTRLVDAVLDQPAAAPGTQLDVTLSAGDAEILHRLRDRCDDVDTRAAGASIRATGTVPDNT